MMTGIFITGLLFVISSIVLLFAGVWEPPIWLKNIGVSFFNSASPDWTWLEIKKAYRDNMLVVIPAVFINALLGITSVFVSVVFFKEMLRAKYKNIGDKK
jgi:MFS superfamily sulfate permease-like transporter